MPTLAPGQYLTGSVINRVFSNNKPVYIRPCRQILKQLVNKEKRQRYNFPDNVFDDNDYDWMPSTINENENSFDALQDMTQLSQHEPSSQIMQNNQSQMDMEEPLLLQVENTQTQLVREIAINCNNVLKDMIIAFKDEIILSCCLEIVFIDERGNIEDGRGAGVKREALSIFWREFYNSLATGASEKVPAIRHDYQQSEWKSIACVLVAEFIKFGYFPVTLSSAFIASCLFPEELLVESFHQYISKDESETLKKSVTDECPDPSTDEDVTDVLSMTQCQK
ncbi:Hypothetical predicted protein [Paramuricea clavata]|uniref:Uncharacterized protein n=1 Tax=Paramuricea clavata TaxID=317549 RepID=A0A6S7GMP0_PARCT|nr:Hypothetical predicted protein [Paramuricea clavata]